jgi:hypothetical protein
MFRKSTEPGVSDYQHERFVRRWPVDKPVELDEPGSPLFNATWHEEIVV